MPTELETRLVTLDREECLRLLSTSNLGRVAVNAPGWPPVIRPVTYVFDRPSQSVVFRSDRGSKFTALLHAGEAAFEVDGVDSSEHTGWSVIVVGMAEIVDRASEVHRLDQLGLHPWAPGNRPHWIRIRAPVVSGRRITAVDPGWSGRIG